MLEYFEGELNILIKFHLEISVVFLPVHLDINAVNHSLLHLYYCFENISAIAVA